MQVHSAPSYASDLESAGWTQADTLLCLISQPLGGGWPFFLLWFWLAVVTAVHGKKDSHVWPGGRGGGGRGAGGCRLAGRHWPSPSKVRHGATVTWRPPPRRPARSWRGVPAPICSLLRTRYKSSTGLARVALSGHGGKRPGVSALPGSRAARGLAGLRRRGEVAAGRRGGVP